MERDPWRRIILAYAATYARDGLTALLALDDALALLLRTTTQPAVGQLRLAWWREALAKLDIAPAPAEPVLQALARHVLPKGVRGEALVPIVHGWEVLIEEDVLGHAALVQFGEGRGRLFATAATILSANASDPVEIAGQGWALADLAGNLADPREAAEARAIAAPLLAEAAGQRWSRNGRALGALTHLARIGLEAPQMGPRHVARLFWHRLTGC
ncbi:hypothetical protein AB2M62_08325 [Sphingomonas sp. MMS12-HWE2-04]|uniref:hypothetical protein n=1 Tax=Sphingomonas sp. MMS12-HWE2-04 TaxID=3234199 RepID=UPI00384C2653